MGWGIQKCLPIIYCLICAGLACSQVKPASLCCWGLRNKRDTWWADQYCPWQSQRNSLSKQGSWLDPLFSRFTCGSMQETHLSGDDCHSEMTLFLWPPSQPRQQVPCEVVAEVCILRTSCRPTNSAPFPSLGEAELLPQRKSVSSNVRHQRLGDLKAPPEPPAGEHKHPFLTSKIKYIDCFPIFWVQACCFEQYNVRKLLVLFF